MWLLSALVTTICFGTNNTIFKWSSGQGLSKVNIQLFFYVIAFILTSGYAILIGSFHLNLMTIILGALIGILNANGNIQMTRAFEKGPASLTAPLIAANAIVPIIGAGLIFHETISSFQWLGIIFMLCSAMVIQYTPNSKSNTQYLHWIIRIVMAILSFGILGILMKTTSFLHIDSLHILMAMYGGGSVYLLITSLVGKEIVKAQEVKIGSMVGVISIVGYSCYFYAIQNGISSIVFPVVSLNCLIVVLSGCYIYKEKLKVYQLMGVLSALLGVVLTKL
ncbi:EamA family transporter [Neobacillus sp. D3-1R]|uniref:EamA family transporter n=1 Tax=Neobacillus sp. D3-1R TaxID=3445778 RepID=UPI003F9FBD60